MLKLKLKIGKAIQRAREANRLSLEELGQRIGTDKGNVSRIENKGQLTLDKLEQIAKALHVSVADLCAPDAAFPENSIDVPLLNAYGSMGEGEGVPDDEMGVDVLRLKKDWIARNFQGVSNLTFIHAIGDSMSPTVASGDILLVDTGVGHVPVDGVYVLFAHGRLFIKRVRQRMDGSYEITSDNPTVKTVDVLDGGQEVEVRGRALWVWDGKRL